MALSKQQVILAMQQFASANGLNLAEMVITHGGAMVMNDQRGDTGDIDLTVSQEIWDKFANKPGYSVVDLGGGFGLISVTTDIDIHLNDEVLHEECAVYNGIRYRTLKQCLQDYQKLNRPKDQAVIASLKKIVK